MTLPIYQRRGLGSFLIDFSIYIYLKLGYLLSRKEEKSGGPEKPLSELGNLSYSRYWRLKILEILCSTQSRKINFKDVCLKTGISELDIVETLQSMDMIISENGKYLLRFDKSKAQKLLKQYQSKNYPVPSISLLKWSPSPFRKAILAERESLSDQDFSDMDIDSAIDQCLFISKNLI